MHSLMAEDGAPVAEALKHLLEYAGFMVDYSRLRDCHAFAASRAYNLVIADCGVGCVLTLEC